MPVRKYRCLSEKDHEPHWLPTGDPRIIKEIRHLWRLSEVLLQPVGTCIPRGVRKYRSIEDAAADRNRWEQERVDRLRFERKHL